jgi:thiosulfate dehydrogenase (quinone) large subunit
MASGENPGHSKESAVNVTNMQDLATNATGIARMELASSTFSREAASGRALGYVVLRGCLGFAFMLHGVARIFFGHFHPYLTEYTNRFVGSPLPLVVAKTFLAVLPFVEAVLGFLLLIGLATRYTLCFCGFIMFCLLFGTCLRQDWNGAQTQLIYTFLFAYLLMNIEWNRWSIDEFRQSRK